VHNAIYQHLRIYGLLKKFQTQINIKSKNIKSKKNHRGYNIVDVENPYLNKCGIGPIRV